MKNLIFQPKFILVSGSDVAADYINKPHEDYPYRVDDTKKQIDKLISAPMAIILYESDIKSIHSEIMWNLKPEDQVGEYRKFFVTVGNYQPTAPDNIQFEIDDRKLFPIQRGVINPTHWYYEFERIHPFLDGNGRVGGVVLAWLTYNVRNNTMLAPLQ